MPANRSRRIQTLRRQPEYYYPQGPMSYEEILYWREKNGPGGMGGFWDYVPEALGGTSSTPTTAAPSEAELTEAKLKAVQRRYNWYGPSWSNSGLFTQRLVSGNLAYDRAENNRARQDGQGALDMAAGLSGRARTVAQELLNDFGEWTSIRQNLPPEVRISEEQARAEEMARFGALEEAQREWVRSEETPEKIAEYQAENELTQALARGDFGAELGYALGALGPLGKKVGDQIPKQAASAAEFLTPGLKKLALYGGVGLAIYAAITILPAVARARR